MNYALQSKASTFLNYLTDIALYHPQAIDALIQARQTNGEETMQQSSDYRHPKLTAEDQHRVVKNVVHGFAPCSQEQKSCCGACREGRWWKNLSYEDRELRLEAAKGD